jgi:hypothetical protein
MYKLERCTRPSDPQATPDRGELRSAQFSRPQHMTQPMGTAKLMTNATGRAIRTARGPVSGRTGMPAAGVAAGHGVGTAEQGCLCLAAVQTRYCSSVDRLLGRQAGRPAGRQAHSDL